MRVSIFVVSVWIIFMYISYIPSQYLLMKVCGEEMVIGLYYFVRFFNITSVYNGVS